LDDDGSVAGGREAVLVGGDVVDMSVSGDFLVEAEVLLDCGGRSLPRGFPEEHTMLTTIAFWIVVVLMIVIVPVGCSMMRPRKPQDRLPPFH
jgi:hypothetical protein